MPQLVGFWRQEFANWRAVLLLALVILSGCTNIALPRDDAQPPAVDPGYRTIIANRLKESFKTLSSYDSGEISDPRWVHSMKGWGWLFCVRFQDHGHRRTYALFISGSGIIDSRYAVQRDACDAPNYSPFDLATGATVPTAIGNPGPLY